MSHIRAAAHRIRFRCHQMKIDYYHKRYNNDDSRNVISERVPHAPFWSLKTPEFEMNVDDESTINGDDYKLSEDLNSCMAVFDQPFTTEVQAADNVTLVDEQEFSNINDCNCQVKDEFQAVSDASPVTADLSNTQAVQLKEDALIPNVEPAELNFDDADMNIVTIVSNLEAALVGVEVVNHDSAISKTSHPRHFRNIFNLKVGKGQKRAINTEPPIANCNSEITKLADKGDIPSTGNMADDPVITKRQNKSVGRHILKAFKHAPPQPTKRSFIVHNVVRPAHLYSRENLLLPVQEAPIKDSSPPVKVSSSVYSDHGQLTSKPAQPPIHQLVRKTSFVRRSSSIRSNSRRSSSRYSRTSVTSSAHSRAYAATGNCQCVSCHNKYGSNEAWKKVGNRCSLQAALFSIGNDAAAAYGGKPLNADLTDCKIEEAPIEVGHQMLDKDSSTADLEMSNNDTAASIGIKLKAFKLSKHPTVHDSSTTADSSPIKAGPQMFNSVFPATDLKMPINGKADTTSIGTELKAFKLSKHSTVNGAHIAAERSPIKSSYMGSLSLKEKSVERVKIISEMLSIDENHESNITPTPVAGSHSNDESLQNLISRIKALKIKLKQISPYTTDYQQKMNELARAIDELDERGARLSKLSLSKEDQDQSAVGDADQTIDSDISKSHQLTSIDPNEEAYEKEQLESSNSFPPAISNAVASIKASFASLNTFGF